MEDFDFDSYQKASHRFSTYPVISSKLSYPLLGLAGETGELLEKMKKLFRDHNGEITPEIKDGIKRELGDILWYVSEIATLMELRLSDIARTNYRKLLGRKKSSLLKGSGDYRGEEKEEEKVIPSVSISNKSEDVLSIPVKGIEKKEGKWYWECTEPYKPEHSKSNPLDTQVGGDHYKKFAIQPVEFAERNNLSFLQSCIIKRVCRLKDLDYDKIKHEVDLLKMLKGEEK